MDLICYTDLKLLNNWEAVGAHRSTVGTTSDPMFHRATKDFTPKTSLLGTILMAAVSMVAPTMHVDQHANILSNGWLQS